MEWGCKSFTVKMHSQIVKGSRKETNPIADGIMFGLNSPSGQKLKLSDIHLLTPPFCTVLREFVNFTEYPISFYYVAEKNGDIGMDGFSKIVGDNMSFLCFNS